MDHPPTAANAAETRNEKLRHLPPAARAAFQRFQSTRDARELDVVIFAILEDFIPRQREKSVAEHPGDTRLMDDLGFDSLALTEIIFFSEELFNITISNEEILQVLLHPESNGVLDQPLAGHDGCGGRRGQAAN